jgi:hypothetical protein
LLLPSFASLLAILQSFGVYQSSVLQATTALTNSKQAPLHHRRAHPRGTFSLDFHRRVWSIRSFVGPILRRIVRHWSSTNE